MWIIKKKFNSIRSIHAQSWQPTWKTWLREKRVQCMLQNAIKRASHELTSRQYF